MYAILYVQYVGLFTNIVAKWPGCTHDSHIFKSSEVGRHLIGTSLDDGILLGDSGYACAPYLMTPYPNPATASEEHYNRAHKVTRCLIERTFGLLKRRFHVVHSEIRMAPDRVCTIIVACSVLHNIAIYFREPDLDDASESDRNLADIQDHYHGSESGQAVRRHITNSFF